MPEFSYKARTSENTTISGLVQAASEDLAVESLRERGLTILYLHPVSGGILGVSLSFLKHIKVRDTVVFSRQLAVLVSANVPLVQSLRILIAQTPNKHLKVAVSEIADDVEAGTKLSVALGRHRRVFDSFYVNIIRSGETSGKLDEVLEYLANQLEKDYDLTSRIKGAMIYPIFILSGLVVVGVLMMVYVIPKITDILIESGVELPLSTKILITASDILQHWWLLLLLTLVGLAVGGYYSLRTPAGRLAWDTVKLRVPVFGKLYQRIALVRFSRSLHTLIVGGVNLPQALAITADVVGNEVYRKVILATIREVEDGNPIASVFLHSPVVPFMVSQMLNVGEKTGRIDHVLEKMTDFYTREIDNVVRNLVSLIEPMVIATMAVAVGLMVAAVILPLYKLTEAV
ncbi:MAG: type II secretion system F family protein [Patescibacteria group bacterium]|nr:type II secretion system F family protein [Patescibacteria group bacterium]